MKKTYTKTPFKPSDFLGNFQPKIKRIKIEPRERIRQLLRSSIPRDLINYRRQYDEQLNT